MVLGGVQSTTDQASLASIILLGGMIGAGMSLGPDQGKEMWWVGLAERGGSRL